MQITLLSGNLIKKRLTDTKDDKNDGAFNILEEDNLRKIDIAIHEIVSLTGFYGRPHPTTLFCQWFYAKPSRKAC